MQNFTEAGPLWREEIGARTPRRVNAPGWRRAPQTPTPALPVNRWALRVAVVLLGMAVLLTLLLWVSSWLRLAAPARLVLIGASYEENLNFPVNLSGTTGLKELALYAREQPALPLRGGPLLRLDQWPVKLRVGAAWDQALDQISEDTVLVCFAVHGGADAQGAYLLPDDADVRDLPENRLRLEAVLDRLARVPESKKKVLILDATQMPANWQLGMLQNDFARALEQLEPRIAAIPNLVVLSASGPGQRSWSSRQWRLTAFTHFLLEGLKGATADDDGDGRVSLWESYQYLAPCVTSWVWANRQAWQTPMLLPSGDLGKRRAQAVTVALTGSYTAPEPPPYAAWEPPPELLDAWQRRQKLSEQVPAPAAYTPALWRRYNDILLRYEELLVLEHGECATRLAGQLYTLEQSMERARAIELKSAINTLHLAATVGGPVGAPPAPVVQQFDQLWNGPSENYGKQWEALQAQHKDQISRLRLQFLDLLVDRTADDPAGNLAKAAHLAGVLADPARPLPAELHYLVMLQRDLPKHTPPKDLLKLALRTVDLGEEAALGFEIGHYPYSECVYPWLQESVAAGDRRRRLGQDLLFASDSASLEKAAVELLAGRTSYRAALARAAAVRAAYATRDRALAVLPYYSRWLAQRRQPDDHRLQSENAARLMEVDKLWQAVHHLVHLLDQGPSAAASTEALAAATNDVRRPLDLLAEAFVQHCLSLTEVTLQSAWRDIDDVLLVPDMTPDLRIQLLRSRQRIAQTLLLETARTPRGVHIVEPPDALERVKREGQTQGRLALAVLGHRWFDASSTGRDAFPQALHRLETFGVEEKWWESLAKVGSQIGHSWRQLPLEIDRQVQRGQTLDRATDLPALQAASRLERLLNGGLSLQVSSLPAELERRLRLEGLLLWQTERTWEDHWFAQDPKSEPYYRTAGIRYVEDATALDLRPSSPDPQIVALRGRLTQPGTLTFSGPVRQSVTTEPRFGIDYQVQPAAGATVPAGTPVVWVESGPHLALVAPAAQERVVRHVGGDRADAVLRCQVQSPLLEYAEQTPPTTPAVDVASVRVRGLFRGQFIERDTKVSLYPLADTIVTQVPAPERGSIAVRGTETIIQRFGASNGAVAIVLDVSGSMGPPAGQSYGQSTKYNEALRALRQMLSRVPKGTTVSLWVFGQAVGVRKTVADAEQTIRRILPPTTWDPEDAAQLRDLMARLAYPNLEPWNESPIVRAMVSAKEDLRNATGFKTLLVLTDGMDNRFANDRELNPDKLAIPAYLTKAFRDSGIVVNMVGYKVVDKEQQQAEEQFKVIEKLPLPGKFVTVSDARELAGSLELALRQSLRYWVDSEGNVPVPGPARGVEISMLGNNDRWYPGGLTPAMYKLVAHTDRRLEKSITIERGDLLLVDLVPRDGGAVFERALYSPSAFPWKPALEKSDWRLAALQNQATAGPGLQMLLTLEKLFNPREDTLQVLRPRRTWVEVALPPEVRTPFATRWGEIAGYPAPAWSVDVPAWPSNGGALARPVVRVWWDPDQELAPAATLERGADFQNYRDLVDRPVYVDGDQVRVLRVAVEDHRVETRPGVRELKKCLVVRLEHAAGKPVWAQVRGLAAAGSEQRFYTEAGQTTGLFWPVTADQAEQSLAAIRLYSLAAFKRDCVRRGYYLEMRDLAVPEPGDVRPRPALPRSDTP